MYELTEKKRGKVIKHMFSRKEDYDNYVDYMCNGLRIVSWSPDKRTYFFNNGAVCSIIKIISTGENKIFLHINNRCTQDKRQTKKYAALIEKFLG